MKSSIIEFILTLLDTTLPLPMITVEDLCFDYPGTRALNHISFSIQPHSITALVGPNGAGKTTLLRCLSALESPMSGKITIDGFDSDRFPRKVHAVTSYLSDFFGLYDDLTVSQNLTFYAWSHLCDPSETPKLVEKAAKRLNIWEYRDKAAGKLSRGQRQRLAIAQTILHEPKILLLDEPASGLDPKARHQLSDLLLTLEREGITLIVSSHILSELEDYSTHMLVLKEGALINHCALSDYHKEQPNLLRIELTADAEPFLGVFRSIKSLTLSASKKKNEVIVQFKGNATEQQALLKTLIDQGVPVCSITPIKQNMQEVYLDIADNNKKPD